ncbi:MAG: MOSC domain-containing protein [Verrucomicrobiales bacterium]|nr:MOSC domain-containing protein [Verrucomicrobiales bacterium]
MTVAGTLLSLQIGTIADTPATGSDAWWDKPWSSGFRKSPVEQPIWLAYGGLRGDQQADPRHHGGADKAVCVYPSEHAPHWTALPELASLAPGGFGENFTTTGLLEENVCLGDLYHLGEALVEVSQPRQPCWKLARRWRLKDLAARVEESGRTGFYFRVRRHGWVQRGQTFTLEARPFSQLTLALANQVMHHRQTDRDAARQLAECPALSASWKDALWARATA